MELTPTHYNISDYDKIIKYDYKLPEEVLEIIKFLDESENNKIIKRNDKMTSFSKYSNNKPEEKYYKKKIFENKTKEEKIKNDENDEKWKKIERENLKITELKKKEGIEKLIGNINSSINKFSSNNYQKLFNDIFTMVESFKEVDNIENKDKEENILDNEVTLSVCNYIFNRIIKHPTLFKENKILNIYVNFYIELYNKYPEIITKLLNDFLNDIKKTFDNMIYCLSDNDDDYQENNKLNGIRKSNILFILSLIELNHDLLTIDYVYEFLDLCQNKLYEYLILKDENNKIDNKVCTDLSYKPEIIIEIIYIILNRFNIKLKEYNNDMFDINIHKLKNIYDNKNDYLNISSKTKFTMEDIFKF